MITGAKGCTAASLRNPTDGGLGMSREGAESVRIATLGPFPRRLHRQPAAVLSLTCIAACKLALFLVLLQAGYVQPYVGNGAKNFFLPIANDILATGTFNDAHTSARSKVAPGYAVFLAFVQWISAHAHLSLVVCVQMLMDYFVALLLLFLGARETSTEAGWLAGVLWLLFPPAVVLSTWIAAETLATTLLVLSTVMLIRSLSQGTGLRLSFAAGLALGVATLVRATTQMLPLLFLGLSFLPHVCRHRLRYALLVLGMCVIILPWAVRNVYVLGDAILVQTGIGPVFLMGSRSEYFTIEGMKQHEPLLRRQAAAEGLVEPTDVTGSVVDRWRFRLGLREYRIRLEENPLSVFPLALHKFARLWYGMEEGVFYRQAILAMCSLLVVPLGLLQICCWKAQHPHLFTVLGGLSLYFIGLHMINLPIFRYMFPLYPFLIFAASHRYITIGHWAGQQLLSRDAHESGLWLRRRRERA